MLHRSPFTFETAVLDPQTQWTRRRLQILLGGGAFIALAVLAGGVWAVASIVTGSPVAVDTSHAVMQSPQDQMASKPLPDAPLEAAQPGSLSTGETGTLEIPAPTDVGAVAVATGFPRTPEGALAQLAAIDSTALTSASVRTAQDVIAQWAAPGGPTPENWTGVQAVATLLESAGMSSDARNSITIAVEPKMGFIKGTVGDDFVVPCIDFIVTATLRTEPITDGTLSHPRAGQPREVAAADCQRMVWLDGRWMIGPGEEPAAAPALWPGSQASFDAGYQWLEVPQS